MLAEGRAVHVLITIAFHVRSADALGDRYRAVLWGPPEAAARLRDPRRLRDLRPGEPGPAGVTACTIGDPPREEHPLWLPSHAAVAFGDAVVTTPQGELRIWMTGEQRPFLDERFAPTLATYRLSAAGDRVHECRGARRRGAASVLGAADAQAGVVKRSGFSTICEKRTTVTVSSMVTDLP